MTLELRLAVHSFPGERPVLLVHGFTRSSQLLLAVFERPAVWISAHQLAV
jgi:hypothetical protein